MKSFKSKLYILISALSFLFLLPSSVKADSSLPFTGGFCSFFPCDQFWKDDVTGGGSGALTRVQSYIKYGFSIVFVGIVIYGIFLVIKAALKIIRSEGDSAKVEEGYNMFKGVWIGIGLIFVGILGIVIIIALFNAVSLTNTPVENPGGINVPLLQ